MEVVELGRNRKRFAIHGSALTLGNVLLPSCWIVGRALSKSNILHSHKYKNISAQYAHLNFEMYNVRVEIVKVSVESAGW